MKTKSKAFIIIGSILVVLLAAILTLSLVKIDPIGKLPDYSYVNAYNLSGTSPMAANDETKAKLDKGIKDTRFSIMHAMLEGRFSYGFKFKTYKDEDGKTVRSEMSATDIKNVKATETAYMLEFVYGAPVTMKVQGEEISFDRIKMLVPDFSGEVGTVELVPYLFDRIDNQSDDENISSETYIVNPIKVRLYTSKLTIALADINTLLAGSPSQD